jgi:hypothetical protein
LTDEVTAGQEGVAGFAGEILGRVGEAEQGEESAPDGELHPGGGPAGQINDDQRQNQHQTQRNIMRPFEHPFSFQHMALAQVRHRHDPKANRLAGSSPWTNAMVLRWMSEKLLGIGRNALEKLEFLQHTAGAYRR